MREQTVIRHEILYRQIDDLAQKLKEQGESDFAAQAIKQVSNDTGYSILSLRDIYYDKRLCER